MAIDISAFTDLNEYRANIDALIDAQKSLRMAEGFEEIMVPGEPEFRIQAQREKGGIPLPIGTVENIRPIASRFGVDMPFGE